MSNLNNKKLLGLRADLSSFYYEISIFQGMFIMHGCFYVFWFLVVRIGFYSITNIGENGVCGTSV